MQSPRVLLLLTTAALLAASCADPAPATQPTNNGGTNNATNNGSNNVTNNGTNNGTNNATNNGSNNSTNNGTNNPINNGTNNVTNNGTNNVTNNGTNNVTNNGTIVDLCDPNPCTEQQAATCDADGVTLLTFAAVGDCTDDGTDVTCDYASTPTDCGATGQVCRSGACIAVSTGPAAGEIVITELLYDPHFELLDDTAEWFELHNPTGSDLDLTGCTVAEDGGMSNVIDGLVIEAGGYAVFARSETNNGGITPDALFTFALGNGGDTLSLTCEGTLIDSVRYDDGATFPDARAYSLSLDPGSIDATANDDAANWCLAQDIFHVGTTAGQDNYGTPGAANPACPIPDVVVDWCRLQWPLQADADAGSPLTVYGRAFEAGVTDLTTATDVSANLRGQAGYGPVGSDPAGVDWVWTDAGPNVGWIDADAMPAEPGNDEYEATFNAPAPGMWDLAFRFSRDGGTTWLTCDRDARADGRGDGSADGYMSQDAGHLTSLASPCTDNPCALQIPAATCDADGFTLVTSVGPGTCTVDGAGFTCDYTTTTLNCGLNGSTCVDGACSDPPQNPAPGELVFTEILYDSEAPLAETAAEWFELYNRVDAPRWLQGCTIKDSANNSITVGGLLIPAMSYALFVRSADPAVNGGLTADATFTFGLNNTGGDSLTLTCGGLEIDRVVYDDGTSFPHAVARSISLDPGARNTTDNDTGANWCLGEGVYFDGAAGPTQDHLGTPGAPNAACPVPDVTIDWCRLQAPLDSPDVVAGTSFTVYGRVFEDGITNRTDATDADPALRAQVGYGPDGTDPGSMGWVWTNATPNAGWNAATAMPAEPGNDEYQATFLAPGSGTYDLAYRFSRDGGMTWLSCDRDAGLGSDGAEDGYQVANAGSLTTLGDPCEPNPCQMAPPSTCADASNLTVFSAPGTCTLSGSSPVCDFSAMLVSCSDQGRLCRDGACVSAVPTPVPGSLVLTEIMYDPGFALDDATAEWVEVRNTSGTAVNLLGCALEDGQGNFTDFAEITILSGRIAVFARSADPMLNGGLTDVVDTFNFDLDDAGDTLTLRCGQTVIDTVTWDDGPGFPDGGQYAIQLNPDTTDADANDLGANWCRVVSPYSMDATNLYFDHHGTPGLDNLPCPDTDGSVDWCRLQWPLDVPDAPTGTRITAYARLYEGGITTLTDRVDVNPWLIAELGYGPRDSDPDRNPAWAWLTASPNPGWVDSMAMPPEPNNDEYMIHFDAPAPGSYDHAFRFTVDGGVSWRYCDRAAGLGSDGAEDGYQIANAGKLTTLDSACAGAPCAGTEPAAACDADGITLLTYDAFCTPTDPMTYVCEHPPTARDCSADGLVCSGGQCLPDVTEAGAGDIIITEIMYDTQDPLIENNAEWFEVYNRTNAPITLDGCEIFDTANATTTIVGLVVDPMGYALFVRTADPMINGGLTADHTFSAQLNNGVETINLRCNGTIIDSVHYDDGGALGFPNAQRFSISLDPASYDAAANDDGANWCLASGMNGYFSGNPVSVSDDHFGTPGQPNPDCP